jgi:hypothetical protein
MEPKTGQAPVVAPVDPVVTPPATPPVASPVVTPPAAPPETPTLSVEDLTKIVADLRRENASHRVTAKDAKDKLDALELSKLSDDERTKAELKKLREETLPAHERTIQQLTVQVAAQTLNVIDPDAAAKLIDWDSVASGTSVEDALKALIVAKPYLLKPTAAPVAAPAVVPAVVPASTSSPAAATASGSALSYTKESLSKMPFAEYEANRDSIQAALREGRVS